MSSSTFTVPSALALDDAGDFPVGLLAAITGAFGDEFGTLHGRPMTRLTLDLERDVDVAFVETTLGFPGAGALFCGGARFTYASTTDGAFHGLAADRFLADAVPAGAEIIYDVASFEPED